MSIGDKVRFWGHVGVHRNHAVLDPVKGNYRGKVTAFYANGDLDVTDTNGHQWRVKAELI
jgi:hypothetical protein